MPVIPATQEAQLGRSQSEATPGKKGKTLSEKKKKQKQKKLGKWFK
jgi:hypothetical protein